MRKRGKYSRPYTTQEVVTENSNRKTVRKGVIFNTKTKCGCIRATPYYDKEFKQSRCLNCGHRVTNGR